MAASLASAACGRPVQPAYPYDPGAVTVTAAENFYGDLLHALGGRHLKVYAFLSDPAGDPHQFAATPANARAVAESRLVLENGLGYDAFMDRLLRASPSRSRRVIDVERLVGSAGGANPHLWYDPGTMPRVAAAAAAALAEIDPPFAATYRANLAAYLAALQPVATRVGDLRQRVAGEAVAFTEPVYAYMARALGLRNLSPSAFTTAVEEGNDPPAGAAAAEEALVTRHQVRALLYNSQAVTRITERLKAVAARAGVPVVGVTELQPAGETFAQWQLAQLDALARALGAA